MARQLHNRTRDNPQVRRAQIIDEAIRILGRRGYHGFTVQELAQRCGLSNAGLLYHFRTKDQLFLAAIQQMEQREIRALAPLIAAIERDERAGVPLTATIDLFHAMFCRGSIQPQLARLYAFLQSESLDKGHPAYDSFRARESAVLELFTKLVAPYVAEPGSAARQLLALSDGLRLQWLRADQSFDVVAEWVRAVTVLVPELGPLREKLRVGVGVKAKTKGARQARKSKQERQNTINAKESYSGGFDNVP